MKKLLFLLASVSFTAAFSQCFIDGSNTINVGESKMYTVKNNTAKCAGCHQWNFSGTNVSFDGDEKQNAIKVKGNATGKTILSLEMISEKGMVRCSKTIDVINARPEVNIASSACDIGLEGFKEVKTREGMVSFVPAKTEGNLKYEWTADYENGEKKSSAKSTAQFSYSKENGIKTLTLKRISSKCMRDFTKTYDANYWRFY